MERLEKLKMKLIGNRLTECLEREDAKKYVTKQVKFNDKVTGVVYFIPEGHRLRPTPKRRRKKRV